MFAMLALLSPPWATLAYSLPAGFPEHFWQTGMRALAPVGKTIRAGIIIQLAAQSGLPDDSRCRPLLWPLDAFSLTGSVLVDMACDLARRAGIAPGFIFGHVLPLGLRSTGLHVLWQRANRKTQLDVARIKRLSGDDYAALARAFIQGEAVLARARRDLVDLELFSLNIDPPWPARPGASKQIAILDCLYERGRLSRRNLCACIGSDIAAPLAALLKRGYVRLELDAPAAENDALLPPPEPQFALNAAQAAAFTDLKDAFDSESAQTRLLYGVTGSGKTAVYLALIRHCLQSGKSALLLAPEVALAHKLERDAAQALPDWPRFFYHGYQTASQRESVFRRLAAQTGPVLAVGARSALFLPLPKPGLIILDEEHDSSYKQDEGFAYHAKELAWFRMQKARGLLVLGSATPDIRSFYANEQGLLPMARLPERVGGGALPPVELVEISPRAGIGGAPADEGLLAPQCEEALQACLRNGEQAVILLNRRGYAPLIYCLGCEKTIRCPHCDIGMAYHKGIGRLVCHYCGYSIPWPGACPSCGASNWLAFGEGTERVAERLEALCGQPALRLDRDAARRAGRMEEILRAFARGEAPFLVGTQMLSKGHHFPNVTLVVVADGDIGLNLPDYRAGERTFQLLAQAAGRAGRGAKPGRALIQTRNPGHYCWRHIVNYDYEGFYRAELALRQKHNYPPFTRLGLLRISFPLASETAMERIRPLGNELRQKARALGATLLGPASAPMPVINGRKRMHCLIKAKDWEPMRQLWLLARAALKPPEFRTLLDLDPVNMM